MNKVILIGNLTRDPELKTTQSGISCVNFTVACQRAFKNAQGVREADFVSCVAWRQTAEFVSKYLRKGMKVAVDGGIQTRTYDDNNGVKRYVTEVLVEHVENHSPRQETQPAPQNQPIDQQTGFPEIKEDGLPF